MRKKWLAIALSMAMVVGAMTGCGGSDGTNDSANSDNSSNSATETSDSGSDDVELLEDGGGKVLNIYVWNTEFKERFEKYYPDYDSETKTIGDVKVNFVTNTNEGGVYQKKLDEALIAQESAAADHSVQLPGVRGQAGDRKVLLHRFRHEIHHGSGQSPDQQRYHLSFQRIRRRMERTDAAAPLPAPLQRRYHYRQRCMDWTGERHHAGGKDRGRSYDSGLLHRGQGHPALQRVRRQSGPVHQEAF